MAAPTTLAPFDTPSQALGAQMPAAQPHATQASNAQQRHGNQGSSRVRSPQISDFARPAQPNSASMQDQLDLVQKFCVYASEIVDTQREDINRISAAMTRMESELKSFKEFLAEMKEELRAIPREKKQSGITSEEIDLLTSSVGEVGRKANEIDTLKLELAMMKGKVKRLENVFQPQHPTSAQHQTATGGEPAQASRSHSDLSFGGHGQANGQGALGQGARQTTEASAAKIQEGDGRERIGRVNNPQGRKRRRRSPSEEVAARRRDDSGLRISNPPTETSHSSSISLRPRRPEQLHPYRPTATLPGREDDDDDDFTPDHSPGVSPSPRSSPNRTGHIGIHSGYASVRGHARSSGQLRGSLSSLVGIRPKEQDELSMDHTNSHRIPSDAINGISGTSPHAKHREESRQTNSKEGSGDVKNKHKITKSGKTDTRGHHIRTGKRMKDEHSPRGDQSQVLDHDNTIKARERALDEEWMREYGLGG
ncbi:MAG: hypothetical protein M1839_009484 [Geoglossum umbratile]|nr:MAG: hypothetical protein M1839_009484 [Geoglossum umbratile]